MYPRPYYMEHMASASCYCLLFIKLTQQMLSIKLATSISGTKK